MKKKQREKSECDKKRNKIYFDNKKERKIKNIKIYIEKKWPKEEVVRYKRKLVFWKTKENINISFLFARNTWIPGKPRFL